MRVHDPSASPRRRWGRAVLAALCLQLPALALLGGPAHAAPGDLDTTFDTDGAVVTPVGTAGDIGNDVVIQPDGKIVVAGDSNGAGSDGFSVVRYNADGSLDTTFDTDGKVITDVVAGENDIGNAVALQSDGKILVAGTAAAGGADPNIAVVRYNANGTVDTAFDTDGVVTTDIAVADTGNDLAVQSDGKIVVVGTSDTDIALVRYNPNGSLDTTFDTDGAVTTDLGGTDLGNDVVVQPDGKVVVAGSSAGNFAVLRYNPNGSLDTTFDTDGIVATNVGGTDVADAVALQADGKVVVAGSSAANFAVVRYNPNGSLDTTFDTDGLVTTDFGGTDNGNDVVIQADGKIIVVGTSGSAFAVARYNADGTLDTSFSADGLVTTPIGAAATGNAVALEPDGRIVVAGTSDADFAVARYQGDPGVTISDASVVEGDFGTRTATFTVTLSAASTSAVTVAYATANGTATSPDDYSSSSGTVTFAAGDTSETISVGVRGDGIDEPDETFFVRLSNPTNVGSLEAQGTGTIVDDDPGPGYWLVASDGGVFAFDAPFSGSTGNIRLNQPIVGMAADPDGRGYWLVAADGGVFAFDAPFSGSTGNIRLNQPIVGMAADPDGKGYWLVAADGGIFAFDATFSGSTGAIRLNKPVVGMAADPDGKGYFLVASDGGIFAFDAVFKGSTGAIRLNQPMVGMAADQDGSGYFLVASDGGIFAFDAVFSGSTGAIRLNRPMVGMAADPDGRGYWLVASDGGIFAFDAVFKGSTGAIRLNQPMVGMAART